MADFHPDGSRRFGTDSRSQYRSCGFGYPFICIAVCPLTRVGAAITAFANIQFSGYLHSDGAEVCLLELSGSRPSPCQHYIPIKCKMQEGIYNAKETGTF